MKNLVLDGQRKAACPSRPVGQFSAKLKEVQQRIEYAYIRRGDQPQALEICMIIAEVELLPDEYDIQIAGDKLPAWMVKEIFGNLGHDNVEMVIENFRHERREIRFKKSYFRTALYNSAFEIESHYINQSNSTNDFGG